jgi:tetratricopeptide (TPR) repeat protein
MNSAALFFLLSFIPLQGAAPEQVVEWKKRYQEGVALEKEGKRMEALAVFSKILEEDPNARGSLFMSGSILIRQFDFKGALPLLEKFQQLEPDHEGGIIALIKVHQALGNTEKVELGRKSLLDARKSGKNPRLRALLSYEREVISRKEGQGGYISVQENLEENPNRFIWAYVELDEKNVMLRRLEWTAVAAPNAVQYALGEPKSEKGVTAKYKIHRLLSEKPDYAKAREIALDILQK